MPDDLYHSDILAWSRAQAERLRRVAAGEPGVNDVDWAHVVEEVEEVGRSELKSVISHFRNAIEHALKVVAWPGHDATEHWMQEIGTFLGDGRDRFEPSMAQHIDLASIYARALKATRGLEMRAPAGPLPETVEIALRDLTDDGFGARDLIARIRAAQAPLLEGRRPGAG